MLLTAALERELHDKILAFAASALPVMAHSGDGLAADSAVSALRADVLRVAAGALDDFAAARNARAPLSRALPTELLQHVAAFLPFRALDAATRVCRRWRAALTADASLWSTINIAFHYTSAGSSGHWADALRRALDRARGRCRTLCIQAAVPALAEEVLPVTELVCGAFGGLRHLCVALDDLELGSPWAGILTAPAPALRTLQVHAASPKSLRLPDGLFAGCAPHLVSVMLVNAYLPFSLGTAKEPALQAVWDFGYYAMPFVSTADVHALCAALPALSDLTLVADQFDGEETPAGFAPPPLDRLCLRGFVPDGILASLAARAAELRILQASGTLRQMAVSAPGRLSEVYVVAEPYRRHEASLVVKYADGTARCVEYEPFFAVLDALRAARHRLADVRVLAIGDALLALVLNDCALQSAFGGLEELTVILGHEPAVPCRHLFSASSSSSSTDDDPRLTACPALHTLRLSAYERYSPVYDPVLLPAARVRRWIPPSVKSLVLRGVVFDVPDAEVCGGGCCEVRREWGFAREGCDEYLYWDVSWWQCFPATASLYV